MKKIPVFGNPREEHDFYFQPVTRIRMKMRKSEPKQRVALITGASGGLGTVVTKMFLDAGYRVSAVALEWPEQLRESDSCMATQLDLTSRAAAESAVKKTLKKWGSLHCLAHLVGVFAEGGGVEKTPDQVWDEVLNVNLRTAVNMMRAVIPGMRAQRGGSITVIGSSAGLLPVVTWS